MKNNTSETAILNLGGDTNRFYTLIGSWSSAAQRGKMMISFESEFQGRFGHVAVRLEHYILIAGGISTIHHGVGKEMKPWLVNGLSHLEVWLYNLYTEQWRKHVISSSQLAPPVTVGACAVSVGEDMFMFGGLKMEEKCCTNILWKLMNVSKESMVWCTIEIESKVETPSPREGHSGWEYAGKFWMFGGDGPSPDGYLNEHGDYVSSGIAEDGCSNQLLCFNPSDDKWTNPKCFGSVPLPCSEHATTRVGSKVWLYGGVHNAIVLDDVHELNMSSCTWTMVQINGQTKPPGVLYCTMNAIADRQLVLHGGRKQVRKASADTWILDLQSHTWRRYTSDCDCARQSHTGIVGLSSYVIICGGAIDPNEGHDVDTTTFHLMLEPKSLHQLAMKTVFKNKGALRWADLPNKLIHLLG